MSHVPKPQDNIRIRIPFQPDAYQANGRIHKISLWHNTALLTASNSPGEHPLTRVTHVFDKLEPGTPIMFHHAPSDVTWAGILVQGYGSRLSVREVMPLMVGA